MKYGNFRSIFNAVLYFYFISDDSFVCQFKKVQSARKGNKLFLSGRAFFSFMFTHLNNILAFILF